MARLYADENFPLPIVVTLRELGHDVLTLQEAGFAAQAIPDEMVLAYARATQRILLTLNRKHFIRLHQQNSDHAGIIVCSFDPDFARQAQQIQRVLDAYQGDLSGQLIRVNRPQDMKRE